MVTTTGPRTRSAARHVAAATTAALCLAAFLAACDPGPAATPAITPGTAVAPRVVVLIAKDYSFIPPIVDLVPGETVILQVVNGGLIVHEAVVGPTPVQDAWEAAEASTVSTPPGPTAVVSVSPDLGGVRIVVASGERRDTTFVVPAAAASEPGGWFVGCHIPGHWAEGMVVPVRFVGPDGRPLPTLGAGTGGTLRAPAAAG
ncbi:MAG: hypothetical protein HW391_676 [Chloroflexi bacterium]|nr:hypothetical protein [Chloroflexota bacterium]